MRNFTTVVAIVVYTGCAITACTTYPAHAVSQEQMSLDMLEVQGIEHEREQARRMQRLEDELQRVRDQLYYMRTTPAPPSVPCGNCTFR